jgi:hypothetical protein
MKIMYRGIRVKEGRTDSILKDGMSSWKNPEHATRDVFRAIKTHHILSKLVKNGMLESRIMEAVNSYRVQLFATEDKDNAFSYARDTPELIYLTLQNGLISKERIHKYLDRVYGLPHVVTFSIDAQPTYQPEINKGIGTWIAPEYIVGIEKVDMTKPDPMHVKIGVTI